MEMRDRFFIKLNGEVEGPFSREEIENLYGARVVNKSTPCRSASGNDWSTVWDCVPTAIHKSFPSGPVPTLKNRYQAGNRTAPVWNPSSGSSRQNPLVVLLSIFGGGAVFLAALLFFVIPQVSESIRSSGKVSINQLQSIPAHGRSTPGDLNNSFERLQQQQDRFNDLIKTQAALTGGIVALYLALGVLCLTSGVFWIWMIITLTKLEPPGSDKIVWTIIVVLLGPVGAIIYFFARYLELNRHQP